MSATEADIVWMRLAAGRTIVDRGLARQTGIDGPRLDQALTDIITGAASEQARTLRDTRHSHVVCVESHGQKWLVKRYPDRRRPWKMRLYDLLRRTIAWREWNGSRRLNALGVRANPPLALVHLDTGLLTGAVSQTLILPFVPGQSLDHYLRQGLALDRSHVARAVGEQVGRLSRAGWCNSDLRPENFIVDDACQRGHAEPVMIDAAGIRRRRGQRAVLKTLWHLVRRCDLASRVSGRERLECLRAALEVDPSLRPLDVHSLAALARRISRIRLVKLDRHEARLKRRRQGQSGVT